MAKTRPGKKDIDAYTIRGTNKVVRGKPTTDFGFLKISEKNKAKVAVK